MEYVPILALLLWAVGLPRADQACTFSIQGLVFLQHVYKWYITGDPLKCFHECTMDKACQSVNYYRHTRLCELNNRTSAGRPDKTRVDETAVYIDNPNRAAVGSSLHVPAESCQEIKEINSVVASGSYWVGIMGQAKQMHCDMMKIDQDLVCSSYTNITDRTRNVKYGNPSNSARCDKTIPVRWYRFTGPSGVAMPTTCIDEHHCNTDAPGWLNGTHPTVQEGIVTRRVCFHWASNCCNWYRDIMLRNCGRFYIYKLRNTLNCQLRYCGTS